MNIFDMIGPVMIGPSSSHTAGALKIASIASQILGSTPVKARIRLYGSFSMTYKGHGTDKAIAGGLMGYSCDDDRIKTSLLSIKQKGLDFVFIPVSDDEDHPNTLRIDLYDAQGKRVWITGESTGGGFVHISEYNSIRVSFSAKTHTLVIPHKDAPGAIASVTGIIACDDINIGSMNVYRAARGSDAAMIIETDGLISNDILDKIKVLPDIVDAIFIKARF